MSAKKKPKKVKYNRKGKVKKKHRTIRAFFLTLFLMMLLLVGSAVGYAYYVITHAETIHPDQIYNTLEVTTQIYDDKGELFDEIYYDENRKIVKYEQIPDNLKNAFIAVEDKTFWTHRGFNFRRIIGAIIESFRGGSISGTSTITQQLARNIFLPEEKDVRSIKRKITEMYYAYEIEQELTKEEILTAYLNTIYLGYSCYGVDAAADTYFSKAVEDLSLAECAALAALPQAPGTYSLLVNEKGEKTTKLSKGLYVNDISEDRRYMVLDLMVEQELVSRDEAEAAKVPATEFIKPGKETEASHSAFKDYLLDTVKKDLMEAYDLDEEQAEKTVFTKGLKIYSTLNTQAQSVITKEFKNKEDFPNTMSDKLEAAMVICEVGTGQIKAMAGTRNADGQKLFNRAVNPRQPGSSIKPLAVYGPALQKSFEYAENGQKFHFVDTGYDKQGKTGYGDYITAGSRVVDEPLRVNGQTWPKNASLSYTGNQTLRTALQLSINTCSIKLLSQIGIDYSMEMVHKFGISTVVDDRSEAYNDINLAALGLGAMTQGATPLDMSLAYATFPNGGVRNSGICYTKVEDRDGKTILEGKSETTKVLDEGVAWIMTDVLKSVVSKGIAKNAAVSGEEVGGKTGTTNDQYDIWFDGFTPKCAAALWIGTDDNVEMDSMSYVAAAMWSKIIGKVKIAKGGKYKAMPSDVIKVNGEYYTKGTEPKTSTSTPRTNMFRQNVEHDEHDDHGDYNHDSHDDDDD